ncbi:Leucine-rich repeat-containing protein 27 [Trachymyrmex zeteki]|uniref:Leucine-rich repeat-containing protein 27 n=1 Tax=Mycetomoellerius zeteki TaxID=64791 RepID=A0A151WKG2_9HYME|nr:PREDICTED: leucine-rich repeat-containing protein 27-like [Trachymyrmex zeteki]KYQ48348.1 Leucine-rich repeat-containing protein 27 [Trachymyrmex zeteki]
MSEDITASLLAQYYGISEEPELNKFPSIQCIGSIENDSDKLIGEQSTVDTNGDDTSKETEMQENDIENKEENSEIDTPARSSRALKWEAIEDNEALSSEFDIIFEANATGNLYENTCISSGKETHDLACSKTASTTLGLEDNEGNDSYLSLSEDVLPDSASDVSSIAGKKTKKSAITFVPPSTPPPNRIPIYNKTFIDLTNAGLTSLPIETIEKYPTIQMLYLENNNISELPERLFVSLQNLQWLDVRNNLLTSLPTSIKSHPSLETILLQGNKIEKLPLELCLVPKLKILNVAHNPITTPPKDIIVLGCSNILSYLRSEWNKLHPNEPVTFVKQEIEPKASTILCYRSPREKRWKLSKIPRRVSKSTNDISDLFRSSTVRKKSKAYKPSNRCESTGANIVIEQRQQWISKARDLLSTQSATIQKIKDLDTVKEWRRDKRSFNKSMEKISRRNEDDIPFAIDIEDYPTIQKRSQKAGDYVDNQKQEKLKLVNINQKIQELSGFLQKFEITKSSEILTPKSKQKYLQTEIEKLSHFQKEVHNLRRYNEIMSAPMNSPNNLS